MNTVINNKNIEVLLKKIQEINPEFKELIYYSEGENYYVYKILSRDDRYVLKLLKENSINKISNIMSCFNLYIEEEVKAPTILYSSNDSKILEDPFIIEEFIDGKEAFQAWEMLEINLKSLILNNLGRELVKLHNITNKYFSTSVKSSEIEINFSNYIIERSKKLIKEIEERPIEVREIMNKAYEIVLNYVENINFEKIKPSLIHRDIHKRNILVKSNEFMGIIDFERSCFFDHLWDFSKLYIELFCEGETLIKEVFKGYQENNLKKYPYYKERINLYLLSEAMWAVAYEFEEESALRLLNKFVLENEVIIEEDLTIK